MGGIMSNPKAAPLPPPPEEPIADLSDEQARKDRLALIRRRRRGRASTLHTGWSGDDYGRSNYLGGDRNQSTATSSGTSSNLKTTLGG